MIYAVYMFIGTIIGIGVYEYGSKLLGKYTYRRREEKFLRFVSIEFPNGKVIESITVASSDKQAIANTERKLREHSRTL